MTAIAVNAIPGSGTLHETLVAARRRGELTATDTALVKLTGTSLARLPAPLQVHLDVLAITVASEQGFACDMAEELQAAGLTPEQVVFELKPPFSGIPKQALIRGVESLRGKGFQIGVADLGDGDIPFALLAQVKPDLVRLDSILVAGLGDDPGRIACVEALTLLCGRLGTRLVAEGVQNTNQLAVLRKFGVHAVRGDLLAPATPHPPHQGLEVGGVLDGLTGAGFEPVPSAPSLTAGELAHPAVTLAETVTAEEVRDRLSEYPDVASIVLVGPTGKATGFLDRNRFLMAVTGAYGHALYAKRPATQLAEAPRTVPPHANALELLELISAAPRHQNNDDLVVVDDNGRCVGVVGVANAMRAMAELQVEHAARLHPLTGLPGTEAITSDVGQRIRRQQAFSVSWLDIDQFKGVNDVLGFAAGDHLIKLVGHKLQTTTLNRPSATIAHVGGDDFLLVAELDDVLPLVSTVLDSPIRVEQSSPTISVATLVCAPGSIDSYQHASRMLAPLKHMAKELSGTSWVVGRPGTDRIDVLRGSNHQQQAAGQSSWPA